jgi:hypothetical protein
MTFTTIAAIDYESRYLTTEKTWDFIFEDLVVSNRKLYKIMPNFVNYQSIVDKINKHLETVKKLDEAKKKERKLKPMTKLNGLTLFRVIAFEDTERPMTFYFTVTGNGYFKDLVSLPAAKDCDCIEIPKCHPYYDDYLKQSDDRTKKPC